MLLVFVPCVIDQPEGKVQLYCVADGSLLMEAVIPAIPVHTVSLREMAEGVAGVDFCVTVAFAAGKEHTPLPTTTLYEPAVFTLNVFVVALLFHR